LERETAKVFGLLILAVVLMVLFVASVVVLLVKRVDELINVVNRGALVNEVLGQEFVEDGLMS
jgi:hypothetical protein